jgi:hypothetical protein
MILYLHIRKQIRAILMTYKTQRRNHPKSISGDMMRMILQYNLNYFDK